jgi:O-methyltransferase
MLIFLFLKHLDILLHIVFFSGIFLISHDDLLHCAFIWLMCSKNILLVAVNSLISPLKKILSVVIFFISSSKCSNFLFNKSIVKLGSLVGVSSIIGASIDLITSIFSLILLYYNYILIILYQIIMHKIFYLIIFISALYIFIKLYHKYNYLTSMHHKIFPIYMNQIKLNNDLTKEQYYNDIIKNVPRNISKDELIYLLQYKKFMELPNVYSMCAYNEIKQTQDLLVDVINNNIEGSLVETGVWRGGIGMWMQAILKYYNVRKDIWLFDMFGLFPEPIHEKDKYINNIIKFLFANPPTVDDVRNNFRKMDLLDSNIKFVVGEFKNTVPVSKINNIALLRLDGDHYDSTMIVLENYYWNISKGGYCIIDDYNNEHIACRNAVDEFRLKHSINNKIIDTHGGSVYWQII